jgi:hypothetical protein
MKIIKVLTLFLFAFLPEEIFGQGRESVEMADAFREDGKIYVVVLGLVIILTGVLIFLIRVDRKIFKLEMRMKKENRN